MFRAIKNRAGFTLIELSIVLLLISIAMGSLLSIAINKTETDRNKDTIAKMEAIEKAIAFYLAENGGIPCPADSSQAPNNAAFGVATRNGVNAYNCNGTSPTWYFNVGFPNLALGSVPTKTLQLPDDYAFDAWGRRFTYSMIEQCNTSNIQYLVAYLPSAVTNPSYNAANNFSLAGTCGTAGTAGFTINSAAGSTIVSNAVYVLLSHGKNGHGAYPHQGAALGTGRVVSATTPGTFEINNALYTAAGANQTGAGVYYQQTENLSTLSSNVNYFDDILHYKTKYQLIKDAKVLNSNIGYSGYICNITKNFLDAFNLIPAQITSVPSSVARICGENSTANCGQKLANQLQEVIGLCL